MDLKQFTKEAIEDALMVDQIFDYETDGDYVSFKTDYADGDYYEVYIDETGIDIPNPNEFGGGYNKDVQFSIKELSGILDHACNEDEGWECY